MIDSRIHTFGETENGEEAHIFLIENGDIRAELTEYGAAVISVTVPDREGNPRDVVLGYDTLKEYENGEALFGATVGRVANRIENARFELEGKSYTLDKNEGENCNHSGFHGFHKRMWTPGKGSASNQEFLLISADGDQGFPGNLALSVNYTLRDDGALVIEYRAICDKDTLLNITNHCYFNLQGQGKGDILEHNLQVFSLEYMPLRGKDSIPNGAICNVLSTAFDFTSPKKIGRDIRNGSCQMEFGNGYNHNYHLSDTKGSVKTAAKVECQESGIGMEVRTDMPGLQFYTGNELKGIRGKRGATYEKYSGFALETQFAPNSINTPTFLSCILRKNMDWTSKTLYRFYKL